MKEVTAKNALFIKLGDKGAWEAESIQKGYIKLGYDSLDHQACINKDTQALRAHYPPNYNAGAFTRHIEQVYKFYHEPETTLWITFHSDRLWWCFAKTEINLDGGQKTRATVDRWRDTDIHGNVLYKSLLSGKLLATQGFQGTICSIKEIEYLLHKINGTSEPHVAAAEKSVMDLQAALIPIIKNLHPKDLETLTDLIFRHSGWQRTGVAGGTERDIDLDLSSPLTRERIAVQVKSRASLSTFNDYKKIFSDARGYSKFYFVTHSPSNALVDSVIANPDESFLLWDAAELARQSVRSGLVDWLIDKAS